VLHSNSDDDFEGYLDTEDGLVAADDHEEDTQGRHFLYVEDLIVEAPTLAESLLMSPSLSPAFQ
jgi:hypothetical protein